jgi:hypothetical protein
VLCCRVVRCSRGGGTIARFGPCGTSSPLTQLNTIAASRHCSLKPPSAERRSTRAPPFPSRLTPDDNAAGCHDSQDLCFLAGQASPLGPSMPNGTQPPTCEFEPHSVAPHSSLQSRCHSASGSRGVHARAEGVRHCPRRALLTLVGLVGASAGLTGVNFALMAERADSVTLCLLVGWERCARTCIPQPLFAHSPARTNHPHLGDAQKLIGFQNAVIGG